MKIALVYFEAKLDKRREHHSVNHTMLKIWQQFYERSRTQATPCLLLDKNTDPPDCWKYESVVVEDDMPPQYKDVLNKVGWMKSQAYDLLGQCVVMDIDALLLKSIDEVQSVSEKIAMAPDIGTARTDWRWIEKWPEAAKKYNAGFVYLNSPDVLQRFRELWQYKQDFINITYYDEIIFSAILFEMQGRILDGIYNTTWAGQQDYSESKVLHFVGERKSDFLSYAYNSLKLI